jgi:peptidoglycan/LPS O-acetylase OafA/YrhL
MVYLLHFGVLSAFRPYFHRVPAAAPAFAVSVLLASLIWFLLEKPVPHLTARRRHSGLLEDAPFSTASHLSLGAQ